ncbi:MAG: tetratricopeptide repeat protein [Deltaproteobacteria bacterium]|nr:tetratricopeptide repeat protein [Deltaproteobacteria bacterium]
MSIKTEISKLLVMEAGPEIRSKISQTGSTILAAEFGDEIIPDEAFLSIGLDPKTNKFKDNAVGEKEFFYFEKCSSAVEAFREKRHEDAVHLLMQAKWDFDDWALAHYLLGLVLLESGEFKSSLDQFEEALAYEPFNTYPLKIFREITHFLVMHPN